LPRRRTGRGADPRSGGWTGSGASRPVCRPPSDRLPAAGHRPEVDWADQRIGAAPGRRQLPQAMDAR